MLHIFGLILVADWHSICCILSWALLQHLKLHILPFLPPWPWCLQGSFSHFFPSVLILPCSALPLLKCFPRGTNSFIVVLSCFLCGINAGAGTKQSPALFSQWPHLQPPSTKILPSAPKIELIRDHQHKIWSVVNWSWCNNESGFWQNLTGLFRVKNYNSMLTIIEISKNLLGNLRHYIVIPFSGSNKI